MKITLDTNVYISAALRGGFSQDILNTFAATGLVTLITSEEILDELVEKLASKFDWKEHDINLFLGFIRTVSKIVAVKEKVSIIKRDPDDNKILECALAGKVDLIVSSDQDLIKLKNFKGIGIIHPKTLSWIFTEYFKKDSN